MIKFASIKRELSAIFTQKNYNNGKMKEYSYPTNTLKGLALTWEGTWWFKMIEILASSDSDRKF